MISTDLFCCHFQMPTHIEESASEQANILKGQLPNFEIAACVHHNQCLTIEPNTTLRQIPDTEILCFSNFAALQVIFSSDIDLHIFNIINNKVRTMEVFLKKALPITYEHHHSIVRHMYHGGNISIPTISLSLSTGVNLHLVSDDSAQNNFLQDMKKNAQLNLVKIINHLLKIYYNLMPHMLSSIMFTLLKSIYRDSAHADFALSLLHGFTTFHQEALAKIKSSKNENFENFLEFLIFTEYRPHQNPDRHIFIYTI